MKAKPISLIILLACMINACQLNERGSISENQTPINVNFEKEPELGEKLPVENATPDFKSEDGGVIEEDSDSQNAETPLVVETALPVVNPLTGLPVENPENLLLPPALVSVTNFPATARPQAGLSFSPIVFELYIGDGMTRYLALFYGDYPRASLPDQTGNASDEKTEGLEPVEIGPIRSGRLPYEYIRKLFSGFIVMASAYSKVAAQISDYVNEFGDDQMDVNSALIPVEKLEDIARANQHNLGEMNLSGMVFDSRPPQGGKTAYSLWIFYAFKNQVFWRFNPDDGSFHRWQDNADGSTFIEQTDRLNGYPLTYENVIVLFADHEVENKYLIDIHLLYVKKGKALLFRDGQMQEIYWTTISEEYEKTTGRMRPIRFIDVEGNPIALKPGQTWIELVPGYTVYWETVNSEKYNQLVAGRSKGSGYWGLYFDLND